MHTVQNQKDFKTSRLLSTSSVWWLSNFLAMKHRWRGGGNDLSLLIEEWKVLFVKPIFFHFNCFPGRRNPAAFPSARGRWEGGSIFRRETGRGWNRERQLLTLYSEFCCVKAVCGLLKETSASLGIVFRQPLVCHNACPHRSLPLESFLTSLWPREKRLEAIRQS